MNLRTAIITLTLSSVFIAVSFSSCKKCYTCNNSATPPTTEKFCKGTAEYEHIKNTGTHINANGTPIACM